MLFSAAKLGTFCIFAVSKKSPKVIFNQHSDEWNTNQGNNNSNIRQKMRNFAGKKTTNSPVMHIDNELNYVQHYSYNDRDIVLVDDINDVPHSNASFVDFVMIIICTHGRIQFKQDGKAVEIGENQAHFCLPGTVLSDYMISVGMKCKVMGFKREMMAEMMYVHKQLWNDVRYMRQHPVLQLSEAETAAALGYFERLRQKLSEPADSPYRYNIILSLLTSMSFELFSIVEQNMEQQWQTAPDGAISQGDLLVKRFLDLVVEHGGHVRSVSDFAEQLNVSPKYLSTVVMRQTGRHALDYISEATVKAIEHRLRHSDLSAKEIANEFDFPNLSFFGRFVKKHLGASPTEFRKNMAK